jgi:peptidyl-tRNA hydrolase, PTH1 family
MKVIVGLGNKGLKYAKTRHNIGFEVIELLASRHKIDMTNRKFKGLVGQGFIEGEKVLLVMPLTYMNLSGECVREVLDYYKIEETDLIVIYDDLSLDIGSIRFRDKGSAGGHNGIKNIISHLGHDRFLRFKLGVGPQPHGIKAENFVLDRFAKSDIETVTGVIEHAANGVEAFLKNGLEFLMNNYTRK